MTSLSCPVCGGDLNPCFEKEPLQPMRHWLECVECGTEFSWDDARLLDESEAA